MTRWLLAIVLAVSGQFRVPLPVPSAITCSSTSDGSVSDTNTKLAAASASGSVVCLPAGTFHWASQVSWTAPTNAILKGAGSTTIAGGNDQTIIIDDFNSTQSLLKIITNASGTFRLVGLTFRGGSATTVKDNAIVEINGSSTQARVDHLTVDRRTYASGNNTKTFYIAVQGVADHNIIYLSTELAWAFHIVNGTTNGNVEWAAATGFGGAAFFFIEDTAVYAVKNGSNVYVGNLTDCHTGGRFVARYNTLSATGIGQTHPTGHAGHDRGCRAHEIYGNTVTSPGNWVSDEPNFAMAYTNSGTSLVWGNSADQVYKNILYFNVCRQDSAGCGYTQVATPNGWGYCGTAFNGTGSNWDGNTSGSTGTPCLDQPGRGAGDLLTGDFPTELNNRTGTIAWPQQTLEPVYEWLNTGTIVSGWGGAYTANISNGRVTQNVDYYLYAGNSSCNQGAGSCTAGVGSGTRAQRPTNCTTGVAWWSTDQGGNWNTASGGANDGTLDVCTATNTWTNASYTPYTYPHPLAN